MNILNLVRRKSNGISGVLGGRLGTMEASLSIRVIRGDGTVENKGVVSRKKVTDAFVAFLVDELQAHTGIENFKYHDSGIGVGAENKTDTALGTPCAEARDTGTQIEGATANIYKTVATHTYADTFAITEHGVFSASSAGTLMDRSVFSAINVVATDSIEFTYQLTINSET